MTRRLIGIAFFAGALLSVVLANWLIVHVGIVNVGFGLVAPAGVYAVALALVCRDVTQNLLGKPASLAAIALGAILSFAISPTFAFASCIAFAASETADFLVYTSLYRRFSGRAWLPAVIPAGLVGIVVDSLLFLWLAFGSEAFLSGQIVGKLWGILAAVVILFPVRKSYAPRPVAA